MLGFSVFMIIAYIILYVINRLLSLGERKREIAHQQALAQLKQDQKELEDALAQAVRMGNFNIKFHTETHAEKEQKSARRKNRNRI